MITDDMGATLNARHPELARFVADQVIRRGRFELASGGVSSYYCDGKLASFSPEGISLIVEAILSEIADFRIDAVGGMDMGATPIVSALALRSHQIGHPMPTFVVRKSQKAHGSRKRVEGLLPSTPSRVAIVDDVVTTGGSILEAIDVVRDLGHDVAVAISVVDREAGGEDSLLERKIEYRPLVRVSELGIQNDVSFESR